MRVGPREAGRVALFAALLALLFGFVAAPPHTTASATSTLSDTTFRNPLNPGPDPYLTHWRGTTT